MSDFVRYDIQDRVAVLTIDNPPVNALAQALASAPGPISPTSPAPIPRRTPSS
jgi:hypothetical protein